MLNAQLEVDNVSEDAFLAKRLVCDYVGSIAAM